MELVLSFSDSVPGGYAIVVNDAVDSGLLLCASQKHPDAYLVLVPSTSRFAEATPADDRLWAAARALIPPVRHDEDNSSVRN